MVRDRRFRLLEPYLWHRRLRLLVSLIDPNAAGFTTVVPTLPKPYTSSLKGTLRGGSANASGERFSASYFAIILGIIAKFYRH